MARRPQSSFMRTLRSPVLAATLGVVVLAVASCGGSSTTETSSTTGAPGNTGTTATTGTVAPVTTAASTTAVPATTTTVRASTTAAPTSAPVTSAPVATAPDDAVWPFASSAERFDDQSLVAMSFAKSYLGFTDPRATAYHAFDAESGEVGIRPGGEPPLTMVRMHRLAADGTWWVTGSATSNIELQAPAAMGTISSPVTLTGQSTAYEATVNVEIRQDGSTAPLVQDVVMGGSMGEMGPFDKAITYTRPAAPAGAIVLKTVSAKDGTIAEATVVRVKFG